MSKRPLVAIIVANRNGRELLRGCLESLLGRGRPSCEHEIWVADNHSTDGSQALVVNAFPTVRRAFHARDLGFCGSNNAVVSRTGTPYVMLLNNDTLVGEGAIDRLVAFLEDHPSAGGVGARLVYPDGREQWSGRRFPTPANALLGRLSALSRVFPETKARRAYVCAEEVARGVPFEVDWISHAGCLYRRQAWDDAGGLDEDMYYWNEPVFTWRMKRAGWTIHLHPDARIVHYEGFGSGARSRGAWRRHHWDFARGSYRFYCVSRELRTADPRRSLAWLGLHGRATVLVALDWLRRPRGA